MNLKFEILYFKYKMLYFKNEKFNSACKSCAKTTDTNIIKLSNFKLIDFALTIYQR